MTTPPPTNDPVRCEVCVGEVLGVEAMVDHIRQRHPGHFSEPERWPDGGLVFESDPSEALR